MTSQRHGSSTSDERRAIGRHLLECAALALAYVVTARWGFRAAFIAEQVSPVWPASGVALAALVWRGPGIWPGIWIGALVANAANHVPLLAAAGIATGNTLEPIVGAWLLHRFTDADKSLDRLRHVTALILGAALVSTIVSATIGVSVLTLAGIQSWTRFGLLWSLWWLGDATGVLTVAPLLLTLRYWRTRPIRSRLGELVLLEAGAIVVAVLVFAVKDSPLTGHHPLEYAVVPLIIWAGLRFAHPGAALVSGTVSLIAVWGTLHGLGAFAVSAASAQESVVLLRIYVSMLGTSGLMLGAAIADRNRSEALRQTNHELTRLLSEERDLKTATPRLLATIGETFDREIGILWLADEEEQALEFVDSWHIRPELDTFIADSRGRRFPKGIGLPGRVWASGRPAWISDVGWDANFPRGPVARELGLHGGFAFPIRVGDKLLGVIEFFSSDDRKVDASLLTMLESSGAQIGQFIKRRQAEQRVAESEALNSAIVNAALDCIVTIDRDGLIVEFNAAATRTFGFTRDEAIGREMAELIVPERLREPHRAAMRRSSETGTGRILDQRIEMPARRKDGTEFPVELAITRLGHRGPSVYTAHLRDITDRKLAEEERGMLLARERSARLDAENANRSKDQFLATVSHELRTPLTAILGWASMLRTRRFEASRLPDIYGSIERNAQAQAQIINDLLDVAKIVSGQIALRLEPTDVCDIVRLSLETIRPTVQAKNIHLISRVAAGPLIVRGDPARLQQVLWNLLSNAAKFTASGGTITLDARSDDDDGIVIAVKDTGIAIAPELLPRVFERFWQADSTTTRSHGGLGLGLALVRHLVDMHGGEVSARSEGEQKGAAFEVRLPLYRMEATGTDHGWQQELALTASADLRHLTALVVDDDPAARELFSEILSSHGARVVCAASAAEAFETVVRHRTDVIVMDIGMPGETGFSLLRRIREREAARGEIPTPAIAVTAYAEASTRAAVLKAGFAAHVPKPVPPHHMLTVVLEAVGEKADLDRHKINREHAETAETTAHHESTTHPQTPATKNTKPRNSSQSDCSQRCRRHSGHSGQAAEPDKRPDQ